MCGSEIWKRLPIRACLHSQNGFRYLHPKNFPGPASRERTVKYPLLNREETARSVSHAYQLLRQWKLEELHLTPC